MAAPTSSMLLSHAEGVSDSVRARELYKYFQPSLPAPILEDIGPVQALPSVAIQEPEPQSQSRESLPEIGLQDEQSPKKTSSPDTALTAFCQLVAWRTGAQRSLISVIDGETQYLIAESTRTVDLVDNTQHAPGDSLWLGCTSAPLAGQVCERTISLLPTTDGEHPYFIVDDMAKDEKYKKLSYVEGPPYFRYYAGVPLITKRGIPIGTLFVLDDKPELNLTAEQIHFMGTMATTIMRHLEMVREVEEHRRGVKMSRGLASFVEGRAELIEAEVEVEEGYPAQPPTSELGVGLGFTRSKSSSVRSVGSTSNVDQKEKEYSSAVSKSQESLLASSSTTVTSPGSTQSKSNTHTVGPPENRLLIRNRTDSNLGDASGAEAESSAMKTLFSRAANLIREAFEVDGAVFYDAQRGFNTYNPKLDRTRTASRDESQASGEDTSSPVDLPEESDLPIPSRRSSGSATSSEGISHSEGMFGRSTVESTKPVEVLGFSTSAGSSVHQDPYPGAHSYVPFDEKQLHRLIRRYSRGKLWTFDSDGFVSSSSEDDARLARKLHVSSSAKEVIRRKIRGDRVKADAKFLLKHFPGVRQLLFVPLWDASRSRWLSGCFAWSTEPTRILSRQGELSFLAAFGNSVMAEVSRMDTEIANQKKGDFIGSISHELRSPLHGILASAEFLGEEVNSSFEKGLVETIDSCGRTLLDTINHILDFSKINHFEQNWRKGKRGGPQTIPKISNTASLRQSDLPMINLFADIDISMVCEEVVEGVFAGHVFQNITAQSFDMVPGARGGKMSDVKGADTDLKSDIHPEVSVIFDLDVDNYHFTTQPGAFRRVIMNLLGNSLKYTSHGYVHITLQAEDMEDLHTSKGVDSTPRSMVTVTITDTGKGISSEFLRSKLFTPFAQENSLSSGTGLGLAIVRSIVALLEGNITIESELGSGTQVKVSLPLLRELPKTTDSSGSKSSASTGRDQDDSIPTLRTKVVGQKVSLCGFDTDSKDPVEYKTAQLLRRSIRNFLSNWYGLQIVPLGQSPDIIVANEANPPTIAKLARSATIQPRRPTILVLCSHSSRFDRGITQAYSKMNLGFVAKPVGPLKLARALLQCLEGEGAALTPGLGPDPGPAVSESSDLSKVFEEISLGPHGGEVLDNSRMAADSANARKAIESPTPNALVEKSHEFPFPSVDKPHVPRSGRSSLRGSPLPTPKLPRLEDPGASAATDVGKKSQPPSPTLAKARPADPSPSITKYSPKLLIVDDNKINLTLLRTYLRKREYELIDEADNGFDAVKKVRDRIEKDEQNYDIIFMDISMPILDGFGATRQIRTLEEGMRNKILKTPLAGPGLAGPIAATNEGDSGEKSTESSPQQHQQPKLPTPALVIALTGLASSQDQNEAFTSGIDLFLTKPVSFKEVGKLLENWEANREKEEMADIHRERDEREKKTG
ncbi:histidine kinase-group I protein [Xylogone sp. PMI_703]|nr:histidine kinase-group I protein [Xylogone sp. PMI_703]